MGLDGASSARGILRTSPAIAERLAAAEAELAKLQNAVTAPAPASIERLLPLVAESYRQLVADLPSALKHDVARARTTLRRILGGGPIRVEVDAKVARFMTQEGRVEAAFLRAAGIGAASQTTLAAGACFANFRRRRALLRAA
jgi:hypothetical protein